MTVLGRSTFLRDSRTGLLVGGLVGVPVGVVMALAGFPEWSEVVLSLLQVTAAAATFGAVGVRVLVQAGHRWVEHRFEPQHRPRLSDYTDPLRPWIRVAAGVLGAAVVVSLAHLVGTGDATLD